MIIPMARVRILGPRTLLQDTLLALQDFGRLHMDEAPRSPGIFLATIDERTARQRRYVSRALDEIEEALSQLDPAALRRIAPTRRKLDCPRWVRMARRIRDRTRALGERARKLAEERATLERYRVFLEAIRPDIERIARSRRLSAFAVVVPSDRRQAVDDVVEAFRTAAGPEFASAVRPLPDGDLALLLVLPKELAANLEERLGSARVPELALPQEYAAEPLTNAVPRMLQRLRELPAELEEIAEERRKLSAVVPELIEARIALHDWLARVDASQRCGVTARAFDIEGWLPEALLPDLVRSLRDRLGPEVVVERTSREEWHAEDTPVVLSNPRLFQPFEAIVRLLPLPRYGSVDPTPFVAVFFPMMFGMMLGDIGYGLLLAGGGLLLHRYSKPGSVWRSLAEIAGPCALFAIAFGFLYGEFFGDLGHRWFGMEPILLDREESLVAALAIAAGLGLTHIVIGLIAGAISARRHPREALGRGLSALMVLLIAVALLAAFEVLPAQVFSPVAFAILVAFPVLVLLEGFLAPLELLATLGNVLSYVRIMAIGTASVLLAAVANRLAGAMGGAVVGFIFALLFHLVNFAIGLFSPAIHALRLHFVEFFGKFYAPGGQSYQPFTHWTPATGGSPP
ncbi:MAG TPA: V-type ATPase 116kDa subunit family protein [Gemmatimonadaceae bacterium]|nr:V-type ATPase 116kDa subunit family protein [Gemmatimonadaceae bacterium]